MNKNDLKTGMVIVFTNNAVGNVLLNTANGDIVVSDDIWFPLENVNTSLKDWRKDRKEVKEVLQPESNSDYAINSFSNLKDITYTIIWENKEDIILTLDGVEYSESTLRLLITKAVTK